MNFIFLLFNTSGILISFLKKYEWLIISGKNFAINKHAMFDNSFRNVMHHAHFVYFCFI